MIWLAYIRALIKNKCQFMRDKICSLPNYGCECKYGLKWGSCTAATFYRKHKHTDYKKAE